MFHILTSKLHKQTRIFKYTLTHHHKKAKTLHCLKSVQIRSFFWSVFSRIRRDTEYLSAFSLNMEKYGPEVTLYLDNFHTVLDIATFTPYSCKFKF